MHATPRPVGLLATLTLLLVGGGAFLVGFVWLPASTGAGTLWQRMCRAAGVVTARSTGADTATASSAYTRVVIPRAALMKGTAAEIGHGATLALRCTVCHGAHGVSGADAPNLAGQYSEVIYKELLDFKRGARVNVVMAAMAATLSDQEMLDLAHYYAYLPPLDPDRRLSDAPALVRVGDPMRSIAPCASCHGRRDGKTGAPALDGEPRLYLADQLRAFANGTRRNDANAVMRGEMPRMTAAEMTLLTDYYASDSP